MEKRPLLTIGMIFKNDIRCIKRCLEALWTLRKALPCELIMADTGSEDGSRMVAEQYADILFDFPWIDDFAAARNAVMDRAAGRWFLTVDTDEYLDRDVSELVQFLREDGWKNQQQCVAGMVIQRNYMTYEMDGEYTDFSAMRLLRMSADCRYVGAIHEGWLPRGKNKWAPITMHLSKTILHHDGYVGLSGEGGKAKSARNSRLLRRELEKDPNNVRALLEYLECSAEEANYLDTVRHAVSLIQGKCAQWKNYGPPIYSRAVAAALHWKIPELDQWVHEAKEWFSDTYYIRIDTEAIVCFDCWNRKKDYTGCIQSGEAYLAACESFDNDPNRMLALEYSSIARHFLPDRFYVKILMAAAYLEKQQPESAVALLEEVDCSRLTLEAVALFTDSLLKLQEESDIETVSLVKTVWEGICQPNPSQKEANQRQSVFVKRGTAAFSAASCQGERREGRAGYTVFLPLAGLCDLGTAACILESEDRESIAALLNQVNRWEEFPAVALAKALKAGIPFPLPEKPLQLEEMDTLASHLAEEHGEVQLLLRRAAGGNFSADWQTLSWARALAITAIQTNNWENKNDVGLVRSFAAVMDAVLTHIYTPEVLTDEGCCVLPSIYRFGWYCVRAFAALDEGAPSEFVRLLRDGLASCESMKPVVEYLLEHMPKTPQEQELLSLAEKVRTMLAAFPPDDPLVAELKASPIYQKVANLIEN